MSNTNTVSVTATTNGMSSSSRFEKSKRSMMDELRSFEKEDFFDLGHPLLNRILHSFIKAAGVIF